MKYFTRSLFSVWIIVFLALAVTTIVALGYNSVTGSINLADGFGGFCDLFAGVGGLIVVGLLLLAVFIVLWSLNHLAKTDYKDRPGTRMAHIGIFLLIVILAVLVILNVNVSITGGLWTTIFRIIIAVVFVTAVTLLIASRFEKRIVPPA